MASYRRNPEAQQRAAERRRREDDALRLRAEVPFLSSLRLQLEERRGGEVIPETAHIRRIVVESAPALFLVPCGDSTCKEGGHDLTARLMERLRAKTEQFEGEDTCRGQTPTGGCPRLLRYTATATYG
jgi:hypothetical protein